MEIPLNITIEKAVIKVEKAKVGNIIGFAEVHFIDNQRKIILKHKGFAIKLKKFSGLSTPQISVDFPAFPSKRGKNGFMTSFIIENENNNLWRQIVEVILKEYAEVTGGISAKELQELENVNPEDIPF